jgi:hypothetical protein
MLEKQVNQAHALRNNKALWMTVPANLVQRTARRARGLCGALQRPVGARTRSELQKKIEEFGLWNISLLRISSKIFIYCPLESGRVLASKAPPPAAAAVQKQML